jgi:hypothetical protein
MAGPQSAEMLVMFWIPGISHRLLLSRVKEMNQFLLYLKNDYQASLIFKAQVFEDNVVLFQKNLRKELGH